MAYSWVDPSVAWKEYLLAASMVDKMADQTAAQ